MALLFFFTMKIGILGLPQSGKTSVLCAASGRSEVGHDGGKSAHRAVVKVPDARLPVLAKLVSTTKIVYAEVEFLDAGGFSGAKEGAALPVTAELRQMDTLLVVVDAFSGMRNPEQDAKAVLDELILNDLAQVEGKVDKLVKLVHMGAKERARELEVLQKCHIALEAERPLVEIGLTPDEEREIRGYTFLSLKPALIVCNISEDEARNAAQWEKKFAPFVSTGKREVAALCAKVEMDLAGISVDDRVEFMRDLGITCPAVDLVIQKAYTLLGLISYFTAGEKEARAWTIHRGSNAQQAAGAIHSDIERGFIRAEVVRYDDYVALQTMPEIKKAGKLRLEGKEYIVHEGDVMLFRFNV